MSIEIERIDTRTAPEPLLAELHEHYVSLDMEDFPNDPPEPFPQRLARWRHHPAHHDVERWILRADGQIAAAAVVLLNNAEDLNNGIARIHVRPDRRRQGLATSLATPVLQALEDGSRKSVIADTRSGSPWEPKLQSLGLKNAYHERVSRLLLADVDWRLMRIWVDRAAERASDYELLAITTPIEERHLGKWCDVMHVMNTAPKEDLEFEDFTMTPDRWREIEKQDTLRGYTLVGHVAVHKPTGAFVGVSEVVIFEHQPELAWQGDTGVDPAHRNRGLGRWLKAATIYRVADEYPRVERVVTDNAGSNEPMLNINYEMGYQPILDRSVWQGEVETIKQRLGSIR